MATSPAYLLRNPAEPVPPDAELNALAVLSSDLQVESRGENVYRVLHGGKWADFRVEGEVAVYVAGTIEHENASEFEYLAAQLIALEGR